MSSLVMSDYSRVSAIEILDLLDFDANDKLIRYLTGEPPELPKGIRKFLNFKIFENLKNDDLVVNLTAFLHFQPKYNCDFRNRKVRILLPMLLDALRLACGHPLFSFCDTTKIAKLHTSGCSPECTQLIQPHASRNASPSLQDDGDEYFRGGRKYIHPWGSNRYALYVKGRFESDKWLGSDGNEGEWPAAYHGTCSKNTYGIAKEGLDVERSKRSRYGFGIYCTPDPKTAKRYGKKFMHNFRAVLVPCRMIAGFQGKNYRIIFQVRVHPEKFQVVKEADEARGEYWLLPDSDFIRPYGICVYECRDRKESRKKMDEGSDECSSNCSLRQ
ncbi:unnamed protein product [Caenorhabditis bovis]|uniref:PARP catalytic domain-containing protein n=1 Tax=Caenorhabditis bovis TaxID=2654633 RepID=A0A8S1ES12_9PELO|nr:unnamed protein product [Caenorhabditis bovis]